MNVNNKNIEKYLGLLLWIVSLIIFFSLIYCIIKYPHIGADGSFSRGLVTLSYWELIKITSIDVHPPLYYLGLKAFVQLLSILNIDIVFACEFFSTIPYLIMLIISYTKIKKDYGLITSGIFSLSLISMSTFFNYYVTVRMYSWAILFVLLTFICLRNVIENSTYKSWILLSLFSVLCAYTHYYAAMIVFLMYVVLLIHILINKSKVNIKAEFKKIVASVILMFILYVPWIFSLLYQINKVHESYWVPQIEMDLVISCLSNWLIITKSFTLEIMAILIVLFFLAYMINEYLSNKDMDDYYVLLGTILFFGTIIFSIVISLTYKPILVFRYIIPAFALLWFSISIKLGKIKNNKILIAIIVVLILISASNVLTQIHSQETSAESFIKENQVYESINNNDSIIIHEDFVRAVRLYYRVNNSYQQYGDYILINNNHSIQYAPSFINNNSQFNIPLDNFKYTDKNVYLVAGPGRNFTDKGSIHFEELDNVRLGLKIYNVSVLDTKENYTPPVESTNNDTRELANLEVTANNNNAGEVNVVVKSNSDLSRRINVTVNNVSNFVSLKDGVANTEFSNLPPGTYQVTISYKGDENYKPNLITTNVEVK